VYLAKSGQISGFEKIVVIKRILPHLSQDKNFSRKFIQEANIAIKLSHVNIVPVLEVGKVAGEFFLALEYVEGRDLRSIQSACYKQSELLPPYLALLAVRDMLTGLSYAHRRIDEMDRKLKIVHCDISPPNVLVSYHGEVKIIDFGIAKSIQMTEDRDESQMGFGKFGYMAPEQVLKGQEVDSRTDLYSAGVVLWELLTGEKMIVFNENTPYKEIAKKVVIEIPKKPSEVNPALSPEIDALVMRAIAKQPEDRFQSASEFRDEVQLALVTLAPTVTNDTLGEYISKLFDYEAAEQRDMLREAKMVDMNLYQMELTTAMEATVSFAVGDDWQEMTGPILPQRGPSTATGSVPPPPLDARSGSYSPAFQSAHAPLDLQPTPSYAGNVAPRTDNTMLYAAAGAVLVIVLVLGGWFMFRNKGSSKDTPARNVQTTTNTSTTTSTSDPIMASDIIIEPTMDATPEVMAPAMVHPPMPITMKPVTVHGMHPTMKWIPRPMVMKPAMVMAPALMAPDEDAKFKANVMARYRNISARYSRFKASHGAVLAGAWSHLRQFVIYNQSAPDFHKKLNAKLNHFSALMAKHQK
ncbi:protein kinase, partial [Myxococcota bacterium]|nr:protein kinase [Myxococcota bacterium]